ncbi:MAG: phosphoribosylanthranilate isomerase [Gemmatimonadetes bacterium]|nr:phosphoribosylanthranilate isomerase [Gemmatimonadota bacterium]
MSRPAIKICGTTSARDARMLGEAGVDFCGILVDVSFSERSLTLNEAQEVAAKSGTKNVVLLCNPDLSLTEDVVRKIRPFAIQLLCQESPSLLAKIKSRIDCEVWKSVHLPEMEDQASIEAYVDAGADTILVDTVDSSEGFFRMGGTGKVSDWDLVSKAVTSLKVPFFVAGGIGPDNAAAAIDALSPYGIDLCSGVEASRGIRDPRKVAALVGNVLPANEEIEGSTT